MTTLLTEDFMEPIEAAHESQSIEITITLSQHEDGCPVKTAIADCLSAHCDCDVTTVYAEPPVQITGHAMSCGSIETALKKYPEVHCTCDSSPDATGAW